MPSPFPYDRYPGPDPADVDPLPYAADVREHVKAVMQADPDVASLVYVDVEDIAAEYVWDWLARHGYRYTPDADDHVRDIATDVYATFPFPEED